MVNGENGKNGGETVGRTVMVGGEQKEAEITTLGTTFIYSAEAETTNESESGRM